MKIRENFVSNSSSSSFIIAVKNKVTVKALKETILKNLGKDIEYFVERYSMYLEDVSDNFSDLDSESKVDEVAKFMAERFYYSYMSGLDIEGWHVSASEFSSEGDGFDLLMYEIGGINSDILKIKSFS